MKKNLFILLAVLLVLPVAVVYASSYTGPGDRTISSGSQCDIVLRYCAQNHNGWRWVADRSWSCGNQSQPWLSWPELSGTCSPVREGEYGWQEERRPTDPVTYDPVSTAYSLTCGTPGNVGWCRGGLTLTLSATEPIPGYNVRRFDDVSGVLCNPSNAPSVTCAIPVTQQGAHTNEFWALSTYGDTSHKRAYTWRLDGLAPALAGTASGSQSGEWYTSDVTVSLSGTDAISGIASSTYRYRVNDGAWQSGANLTLATDGVYAIHAEVQDVAGNIGARNLSIHLDKNPPTLNPVLSGTQQNGWYRTAVKAAANAADETSGIVSVEYRLNGGAWQAGGNLSLDTEGNHEVEFRGTDNAGHITARTITLQIDLTAPTVTTTLSPNGLNGWYVSHPLIPLSALDGLSGVAPDSLQYRWDGLDWTAGESVLVSRDGPHFLEARATDLAGNSGEAVFEVWVDTTPPELEIVVTSESPQHNGWYRESATVTAIATDATSGVSAVSYRLQTAEWQPGSQIVLRDGDHQLTMRATDDAGNMAEEARAFALTGSPRARPSRRPAGH